jgi:uncharacterized membrane protein
MRDYFSKNKTHVLFIVSVVLKGLNGLLELVGALLLFITGELTKLVIFLTQHELGEDPTDFVANHIREFLPYLSLSTQSFAAWYFLIQGVTDIILAIGLLRKKMWAYPVAMVIQILFAIYELYRFTHTHSKTLIVLSAFNLLVVWLIWREYQRIKASNFHDDILLP